MDNGMLKIPLLHPPYIGSAKMRLFPIPGLGLLTSSTYRDQRASFDRIRTGRVKSRCACVVTVGCGLAGGAF
jgi:hypothetical protein